MTRMLAMDKGDGSSFGRWSPKDVMDRMRTGHHDTVFPTLTRGKASF